MLLKAWLAAALPLFGDEAFYWLESTALAPAYTDVPLATPWLIRLGTELFGTNEFGVRFTALLLSLGIVLVVRVWTRRFVDREAANAIALLLFAMPLAATLGVLALPDVPLTLVTVALALATARLVERGHGGDFALFGVLLALGWLSHYRFAVVLIAGVLLVVATERGRALLADRRFWLAQLVGLAGLAPLLWFNASHAWQGFAFQFVERHPFRFDPAALADPLIQALVTTPLLFSALVFGAVIAWCRRNDARAPFDIAAVTGGGLLLVFLVLGLFADAERTRLHWPLAAYLILLPTLGLAFRRWRGADRGGRWRWLPALAIALGAFGTALAFSLLIASTLAAPDARALLSRPFPDNLRGWHEIQDFARAEIGRAAPDAVIAGDFMLAAQTEFTLRGARRVYALDHPRNDKHGRAGQLAILGRDEAALDRVPWQRGLLLVDESARREIERLPALLALCDRFGEVRWRGAERGERVLYGGGWRVLAFDVAPRGARSARAADACRLPPFADLDASTPRRVEHSRALTLRGWAIAEFVGVREVHVLIDGAVVAEATLRQPFDGVRGQWPMSTDPDHPRVGFVAVLPAATFSSRPSTVRLSLRVTARDGTMRELAARGLDFVDSP